MIAIDRVRAALQPWPLLALSTLAGILPLLAFAVIAGERVWPTDWTALLCLALVSQVIGQGLMVYAMGHIRPLLLGLALLSQPVVAAALGWTLYGETMGLLDLLGVGLIATAIMLVRRPSDTRNEVGSHALVQSGDD